MKRHIKLIKTYLKPLKRDFKKRLKNFTQKNCKSLELQKKHGLLWKRYLESVPQNLQLFQLKLLSTKLTFLIQKLADEFSKSFTNIGADLAKKISNAWKRFDSYITKVSTSTESQPLSINELKDAFFSLKINKSPGHNGVRFNCVLM